MPHSIYDAAWAHPERITSLSLSRGKTGACSPLKSSGSGFSPRLMVRLDEVFSYEVNPFNVSGEVRSRNNLRRGLHLNDLQPERFDIFFRN